MSLYEITDCLKAGVSNDAEASYIQRFFNSCRQAAIDLGVEYFLDSGLTTLQAAMAIRSSIIEGIVRMVEVQGIGLSRGFLLPDSPFPKIDEANSRRQIFGKLPWDDATITLYFNSAVELFKVAKAYDDGKITFDRKPAAQILGYEFSVDGISSQSGDPLADILGYQPDGDYVKRKRALDSLARLDFSKRKPYLLFTAQNPLGPGLVVCWARMHDAAGYVIQRHDVFANVDLPEISVDNEASRRSTDDLLRQEWFAQSISFYDWITPQEVLGHLDDSIADNTLYNVKVLGVQRKIPTSPLLFDVASSAVLFNQQLVDATNLSLQQEAQRFQRDISQISPYPALADAIYGDPSFGWYIAGTNILAAIRRGEDQDKIRALSFIGSSPDFLISEAKAGRLFVPNDLAQVQRTIESAIISYGISQVILSALDATGATHFISGKDDPNGLQPTQQSIERSTTGLARILSAIDPETATLDPHLLSTAPQVSKTFDIKTRFSFIQIFGESTKPPVPTFQEVVGPELIDLTTYQGMARLMSLIRLMYDFYPGAFS